MRLLGTALLLLIAAWTAWAELEPPVLLPEEEAVTLLAEADASPYDGADRLVLFDRTEVEVEETGLSHVYNHVFVKVLEFGGARALRALRFDYDPASNLIEIRAVRVHRADSTYIDVDPAEAADVTAPADLIYWGGRMLVLGLPPLEPGDAVETITYKKGFQIAYLDPSAEDDERYIPPMRNHFYDVVLFRGALPMMEKRYTVRVLRKMPLQYSLYNGEVMSSLRFGEDELIYSFWKEDVPAVQEEPRMPDLQDIVPKVVMATVPDWEEKSRWFYDLHEEHEIFAWTPEIEQKVEEITAGLDSEEEKIAALLHWVAQNIRYSGLNMGEGEGYTIHPGIMTFRDRCGVCKDIAGMLVTMLRAAGYDETFPAMTMAGARVEEIPADQFNHCVVALRRENGEYLMLDPTWAPWNNPLWSRWEGEQHYVIGSPWGEDRRMIPPFDPEESLLEVRSEARIRSDGTLAGTLSLQGKGISDGRLRGAVAYGPKSTVRANVEGWLSHISERVVLEEYQFSDHRDFTRDTSLRIRYSVPDFAELLDEDMSFRSPVLLFIAENERLHRMASLPDSEEREHGAFLWAPQKVTVDETITFEGGFEPEAPEVLEKEESLAAASLLWDVKGKKLVLDGEMVLKKRLVPSEDYPGVRETLNELKEAAGADLYAVK